MGYVPHEWVNGETISPELLNNLEEGIQEAKSSSGDNKKTAIVRIKVDINDNISCYVGIALIRYEESRGHWSIENSASALDSFDMSGYNRIAVSEIALDPTGEYKRALAVDDYFYNTFDIITSGGVASEPVIGHVRFSRTGWESPTYYCYPITGDGALTFVSK